ncbi:MAG TPA: hypothetical protein VNY83_07005 [Solirubrobacterales bacterium]|jgi:hypothetical protein|nr:hypothetical protein [Solirubrobacterales bacterium]
MRVKQATLLAFLALALPASASAAPALAPPGNSEAEQYFETLPGSTGGRSANSTATPHGSVRDGVLTPSGLRALRARGAAGSAAAQLAAESAPPGLLPRPGAGRAAGPAGAAPVAALDSSASAPSQSGLGEAFPLVLAGTALAALAYAVQRRRARRSAR